MDFLGKEVGCFGSLEGFDGGAKLSPLSAGKQGWALKVF